MKGKFYLLASIVLLMSLCFVGCKSTAEPETQASMANPASVYCEDNGGTLDIRTDEDGGQYGVCIFENGSECEEWEYYRDECSPEGNESEEEDMSTGIANPASVYCEENGGTLDIRTDEDGGQYGVCILEDGSQCEEWAYYNGECPPDAAGGGSLGEESSAIVGVANPASVYCEENGGDLQLRVDEGGNQYGVCAFADRSECEEWAFFNGECTPENISNDPVPVFGWYGYVITPPAGQPFEYFLTLYPKEVGNAGLVTEDEEIANTLDYFKDSERLVHFWGTLDCMVEGYQGCQLNVTRIRPDGAGEMFDADVVAGWQGKLQSIQRDAPGSGGDDIFILNNSMYPVQYGLDTRDDTLKAQLDTLRDSGVTFSVYGTLTCGVMDANGCQIMVERIEQDEVAVIPPAVDGEKIADWVGLIKSNPENAQFDDYFAKSGFDSGKFGIDSQDTALAQQIVDLRDSDTLVHIWGVLVTDALDVEGTQLIVTKLEVEAQPDIIEAFEDDVAGWTGYIVSTGDMAQYDDYFQLVDETGQLRNTFGIWAEGDLGMQLESLRDTGTVIKIWGTVTYNVPDYNNAQIKVTQLEVQ